MADSKTPAPAPAVTADDVLDIDIPARPPKRYTVGLGGRKYTMRAPKTALAIVLGKKMASSGEDGEGVMRALEDWLKVATDKPTARSIMARLEDPEDSLDFSDILDLLKRMTEKSTGNPTSSPPA